mmetsp:Transcript_56735/g.135134  ORF Transcript_56735/g.135134 Transcript_56735/m.135134 type:complete len:215 (-) Transcript_56735:1045-1689(-)
MNPSTWSDSICHVDNGVWLAIVHTPSIELWEGLLLNDLRVNGSDTVDLGGSHARQTAHANLLHIALLKDTEVCHHGPIAVLLAQSLTPAAIQLANELDMSGQQPLHHLHGPFLQSLRHDSVVGVVAALRGELPGLLPTEVLDVHKQAHHLRNSNGWVGVIHLNCDLLWQFRPLVVGSLDELPQHVLQRCADEEILLLQTQLFALVRRIIGIKNR